MKSGRIVQEQQGEWEEQQWDNKGDEELEEQKL